MASINALTLRTIQDQQCIIERQSELVATLKERVEALEAHNQLLQCHTSRSTLSGSPAIHNNNNHHLHLNKNTGSVNACSAINSDAASYAKEVQLRRQLRTVEREKAQLEATLEKERKAAAALLERLRHQQAESAAAEERWGQKVTEAESKAAAAARLAAAMEAQNARLSDQLLSLRAEAEVRLYETAQWRSLLSAVLQRLDRETSLQAREQIAEVEESVQRYGKGRGAATRARVSLSGAACAGSEGRQGRDQAGGGEGEGEEERSRLVWSHTAQQQQQQQQQQARMAAAAALSKRAEDELRVSEVKARFLTSMNDVMARNRSTAAAPVSAPTGSPRRKLRDVPESLSGAAAAAAAAASSSRTSAGVVNGGGVPSALACPSSEHDGEMALVPVPPGTGEFLLSSPVFVRARPRTVGNSEC